MTTAKPKSLVAIEKQKHELAQTIRAYVRNQIKLWQQVPYLAREAHGRNGWSPGLEYMSGYRSIVECKFGSGPVVDVDLETGELVNGLNGKLVDDDAVLVAASNLNKLDAHSVTSHFKERLSERLTDFYAGAKQTAQREELRKKYSFIKPNLYKRPSIHKLAQIEEAA